MGFVALVPLGAVLNYSFHDIFRLDQAYRVGTQWYEEIMSAPALWASLGRSALFSALALGVQLPLGVAVALMLRRLRPRLAVLMPMVVAVPLVVPVNMIAGPWLALVRPEGGVGQVFTGLGLTFDFKFTALPTWILILVVDCWHWLGLVVIMDCAGLSAIPPAFHRAAAVDGALRVQVFRWIELPKIAGTMWIVLLLRLVDSFMIHPEAMAIDAGGPTGVTTFPSLEPGEEIKACNYGIAAARARVDFLIVLAVVWVFVKLRGSGREAA